MSHPFAVGASSSTVAEVLGQDEELHKKYQEKVGDLRGCGRLTNCRDYRFRSAEVYKKN